MATQTVDGRSRICEAIGTGCRHTQFVHQGGKAPVLPPDPAHKNRSEREYCEMREVKSGVEIEGAVGASVVGVQ